jgi:hypothetical protein
LAAVGAHLILGRLAHRHGSKREVEREFEKASSLLREHAARSQLREVLAEWAELRSGWGDAAGANSLYAEALGRRSSGNTPA